MRFWVTEKLYPLLIITYDVEIWKPNLISYSYTSHSAIRGRQSHVQHPQTGSGGPCTVFHKAHAARKLLTCTALGKVYTIPQRGGEGEKQSCIPSLSRKIDEWYGPTIACTRANVYSSGVATYSVPTWVSLLYYVDISFMTHLMA